jgi:hypothetical protein
MSKNDEGLMILGLVVGALVVGAIANSGHGKFSPDVVSCVPVCK